MGKLERQFQSKLIKDLENRYQGCVILKNDSNYIQGFPDLTILYRDKWAVLECKKERGASHQPNQDRYVEKLNAMSYSAFIFPENRDEVLGELDRVFGEDGKRGEI